jgi:uncharacterized integral membrane protein (TIGR00698 family)
MLPGLALAVLIALAARLAHHALPPSVGSVVGEVLFAVVLGLLVGNAVKLPDSLRPGIRFSFHAVLRIAIVLLGASLSFQQVVATGGKALLIIVVLMSLALTAAHVVGRAAGIPSKLATLIGVGTAVCGNSAIAATAPVIRARDEEVSFAIATNTLFGTMAVILYPILGRALHFDDVTFGTWAGTAVNDTSQVIAAGFAFSEAAGDVATTVKLTRNALMGLVIVGIGMAYAGAEASGPRVSPWKRVQQSIPLFVVGFLVMALLHSIGALDVLSRAFGVNVVTLLRDISRVLILIALAGVGLSTRLDAMRRIGWKPFLLGLALAVLTSATSLLLIHLLGGAGT